jgi:hypothetical protein
MTRRILSKLIPMVVLALATMAGVSSASTTIPTTALPLSLTGEDVNDPQVAVDPSGNAFYAWVRDQPGAGTLKFIQAARVSSSGVVGPVHTVSIATESASSPAVAASPDGTGIVVWQEIQSASSDRQIRSARINANGSLGTIQTMSNTANDVTDPDVGIDSTGKALVIWNQLDGDDTVEARTRNAADTLGSIEDAVSSSATDAAEPQVAVAPNGDAIIAHRGIATGGIEAIFFMRRLANGTYHATDMGTAVSAVSGPTKDQPQVAIDPTSDADAVVTWREDVGTTNAILSRRIESSEAATIAGSVKSVSNASQNADQPQVDLDGAGNAYLTWRRSNGTVTVPQERTMAPDSTLGTTQNLNPSGTLNGDQPQVAVDTAGNATFAWRFGTNIESRGLTSGGTLTAIEPLTSSGSNTEPRVDTNATGARWGAYRVDTAGNDLAVGFFDATPPGFVTTPPPAGSQPTTPGTGSTTPAKKKCKKAKKRATSSKKCKKRKK